MESLFGSYLLEIGLLLGLVFWALYHHLTKNYTFWDKRGVPCLKPRFPFGSLRDIILRKEHLGYAFNSVYKAFPGERYCGVIELHRPILVLRDPDLIKQIMIKDFNYFIDRAPFDVNQKSKFNHLFIMEGEIWRKMRRNLTPAFSSGKMKEMFVLMAKCGEQLEKYLEQASETNGNLNMKDAMARFTIDIIGTCAFGLEINSLQNENTGFYKMACAIFQPNLKELLFFMFNTLFPTFSNILNFQRVKPEVEKELYKLVSSTVKYRKDNKVMRQDFLDILIHLNTKKETIPSGKYDDLDREYVNESEGGLTLDEMVAQVFIFLAAGFETASSTLTFCLYELAQHHDIQDRLRNEVDHGGSINFHHEVDEVLERHGGVTYQALQDMKYMDQVINETLRRYASLSVIHRRCTSMYKVPGSDLVLEKGQKVYIPVYAIHHDPKYYPEPFKFDPERFSPENVRDRHPFVHIPFGDGPRNCIGMRFGLMQTKMGLTSFLKSFRVDVSPDTTFPIELQEKSFVSLPKHPVYLNVTKRETF